jgi:cytoskeletal protein CcmA (bactofilin family)
MFGVGAKIDTLLGQGATFHGDASVEGSIVVDGRLEGDVSATDRVTIGTHGLVRGNITAPEVVIGGALHGNINAGERVELLATAQVFGDIRSPKLAMAEGARVSGKVGMEALPPTETVLAKLQS